MLCTSFWRLQRPPAVPTPRPLLPPHAYTTYTTLLLYPPFLLVQARHAAGCTQFLGASTNCSNSLVGIHSGGDPAALVKWQLVAAAE